MGSARSTITMNAQRILNSSISVSAAALLRQTSPVTKIVSAAAGSATSGGGVDRLYWSTQWGSAPQQQALGGVRQLTQQEAMDSYISSLRGYQTLLPAERFAFNESPNRELKWPRSNRL